MFRKYRPLRTLVISPVSHLFQLETELQGNCLAQQITLRSPVAQSQKGELRRKIIKSKNERFIRKQQQEYQIYFEGELVQIVLSIEAKQIILKEKSFPQIIDALVLLVQRLRDEQQLNNLIKEKTFLGLIVPRSSFLFDFSWIDTFDLVLEKKESFEKTKIIRYLSSYLHLITISADLWEFLTHLRQMPPVTFLDSGEKQAQILNKFLLQVYQNCDQYTIENILQYFKFLKSKAETVSMMKTHTSFNRKGSQSDFRRPTHTSLYGTAASRTFCSNNLPSKDSLSNRRQTGKKNTLSRTSSAGSFRLENSTSKARTYRHQNIFKSAGAVKFRSKPIGKNTPNYSYNTSCNSSMHVIEKPINFQQKQNTKQFKQLNTNQYLSLMGFNKQKGVRESSKKLKNILNIHKEEAMGEMLQRSKQSQKQAQKQMSTQVPFSKIKGKKSQIFEIQESKLFQKKSKKATNTIQQTFSVNIREQISQKKGVPKQEPKDEIQEISLMQTKKVSKVEVKNEVKAEIKNEFKTEVKAEAKASSVQQVSAKAYSKTFFPLAEQSSYSIFLTKLLELRRPYLKTVKSEIFLISFTLNWNYYRIMLEFRKQKEESYKPILENLKKMQAKIDRKESEAHRVMADFHLEGLFQVSQRIRQYQAQSMDSQMDPIPELGVVQAGINTSIVILKTYLLEIGAHLKKKKIQIVQGSPQTFKDLLLIMQMLTVSLLILKQRSRLYHALSEKEPFERSTHFIKADVEGFRQRIEASSLEFTNMDEEINGMKGLLHINDI